MPPVLDGDRSEDMSDRLPVPSPGRNTPTPGVGTAARASDIHMPMVEGGLKPSWIAGCVWPMAEETFTHLNHTQMMQ